MSALQNVQAQGRKGTTLRHYIGPALKSLSSALVSVLTVYILSNILTSPPLFSLWGTELEPVSPIVAKLKFPCLLRRHTLMLYSVIPIHFFRYNTVGHAPGIIHLGAIVTSEYDTAWARLAFYQSPALSYVGPRSTERSYRISNVYRLTNI